MTALALTDPDLVAAIPGEATAAHGRHLSALALIYLRHAVPARAMVLGLAAMTMGDLRPQTVLLVAESLIEAGDPAQALTVLSRFDAGDPAPDAGGDTARTDSGDMGGTVAGLTAAPTAAQVAARHYLAARALYRQGHAAAARAEMDRAILLTEGLVP